MNELLKKFRAQYPQYDDMSDADLARALHGKFYSDMSFEDFAGRIGLAVEPDARTAAQLRVAESGNPVSDFLHQAAEGALFGQADKLAGVGAALVPGGKGFSEGRRAFQQRTDDLQALAPGASLAAGVAPLLATGGAGLARAVQAARTVPASASAAGLVSETGAPLMVPGSRTALEALRTLTSPAARGLMRAGRASARGVKKALPWLGGTVSGAFGAEVGRRLF